MLRPYFKKRTSGVTRIVRDSYGPASNWFALVKAVRARDKNKCVFCQLREDPQSKVYHETHHIIPLSKGGTTTMANLVTACKTCHNKRHNHLHKVRG